MVDAYVEKLLRDITGAESVVRDQRGIYPFKRDDVTYAVHVTGDEADPAVRVWSVALTEVEKSLELLEKLNDVNARILQARCYWANDSVVFEDALPGLSLNRGSFESVLNEVSRASAFFGNALKEEFGGVVPGVAEVPAAAEESSDIPPDPSAEPAPGAGLYL